MEQKSLNQKNEEDSELHDTVGNIKQQRKEAAFDRIIDKHRNMFRGYIMDVEKKLTELKGDTDENN
jgi:hypothetical protein